MPTCQGRYAPPEAVALLPPPARTILNYALFYHGGRHLQKILNIADISDVINEIYGFSLSHETISNIVDRVQPRVIEWQNRRLDKVYPFVYMDALMVSMKSEKKPENMRFTA